MIIMKTLIGNTLLELKRHFAGYQHKRRSYDILNVILHQTATGSLSAFQASSSYCCQIGYLTFSDSFHSVGSNQKRRKLSNHNIWVFFCHIAQLSFEIQLLKVTLFYQLIFFKDWLVLVSIYFLPHIEEFQ